MKLTLKTLMTLGTISLTITTASANCVRQVDNAPLGVCYNEDGQIEDNRKLTNAMLGALLGVSNGKANKPTLQAEPKKIDPTENVYAPFEGTRDFIFEKSDGCQKMNLSEHRLRIMLENLRSNKVHLVVSEMEPDKEAERVYDGFLKKIGQDVGFEASGFNTLILENELYVESADNSTAIQCKAIESNTRTKNNIKSLVNFIEIFRKH